MVREGIILGHVISERGIEVDKAKIETIAKLVPPSCVREVRSFMGHAECQGSFLKLKEALSSAPFLRAPDWLLSFEIMCDASDYAIEAILGQRIEK
ncbi:unnamed protein product [Victoria cruziana]